MPRRRGCTCSWPWATRGSSFPREPFDALTALLGARAREPLRWKTLHLEGESHVTTLVPSLWAGLRWIYAGWSTDASTVAALEQHHAALGRRLGYPIPVPESRWLGAGYQRLDAKDPTGAVALFERATRDHATSANAWDSLADGYEAAGRLDDAERAVARALTLAPPAARAPYLDHQARLRAARRPR